MSSGFVSGGTNEEPLERDDEWRQVQQELEDERRRKAELGKQDGGKSLYEVLEQNKMAKQEAFEEKIKLKNQFRSLDEDEVEFLDSVLESTRAQEAAVKKETAEQLEAFRQQREEAEKALLEDTSPDVRPSAEGEDWKIPSRKRRRDKKDVLLPGKKRKSTSESVSENTAEAEQKSNSKPAEKGRISTSDSGPKAPAPDHSKPNKPEETSKQPDNTKPAKTDQAEAKQAAQPAPLSLGLANYDSDSD